MEGRAEAQGSPDAESVEVPEPPHLGDAPDQPPPSAPPTTQDGPRLTAFLTEWGARERDIVSARVAEKGQKWTKQNADDLAASQLIAALVQGYIQVSQSSLDRAVTRGTYVATAAGAIATAYTALVGTKFSSSAGTTHLASSALIPAIFLGGAIAFSVAYIAFLRQADAGNSPLLGLADDASNSGAESLPEFDERLGRFCDWTYGGVRDRSGYLHLAVYSLALGVVLLPLPFLDLSNETGWILFGIFALSLGGACCELHRKNVGFGGAG